MRMRRAVATGLTALLATAVLAACGNAPDSSSADNGGGSPAASDFLPCIVSDAGGFDDKSFNQLSYEGVQQAADELGVEFKGVESNSENDFAPNLESLVSEGCDTIVTVGFALAAATKDSAKANPDIKYILIDDAADGGDDGATFDGKADQPNIKPLLYDTAQAAFLAGYLAADYTKTGVVGTYGGQPYPTVTIFMDGFSRAPSTTTRRRARTSRSSAGTARTARSPVASRPTRRRPTPRASSSTRTPTSSCRWAARSTRAALTAIADSGKDVAMLGVDADLFETDPNTRTSCSPRS